MMPPNYIPGKRYTLDGATLNAIFTELRKNRLLPGDGYELEISTGGTRLADLRGGAHEPLWGLKVVNAEAGTVKLTNPGRVRKTMAMDHSGNVGITDLGATFTAAAGKLLVLEYNPNLDVVLKMVNEWDGWPMPIDSVESDPPGLWLMEKGYFVLWEFLETSEDPAAVSIAEDLFAERRAYDAHLIFGKSWMEDKDGHVVPIYELLPSQGWRADL